MSVINSAVIMQIEGKVAFISGGAGVIGVALARVLLEAGGRVVIADRNEEALSAAARAMGNPGQLLGVVHDVADAESWTDALTTAEAAFGPVSLLCNNAAIPSRRRPLHEIAVEDWDRIVAVNLRGVFLGARTVAPQMIVRGEGHIVNTASMAGLLAVAGLGDYGATKFAVVGISETMRAELAPFGIGVSVLCPGTTGMGVGRDAAQNAAAVAGGHMDPIWVARSVLRAIETDQLYVITHPDYRHFVAARSDMLLAAFGDPAQPGFRTPAAQLERMSRSVYPPK
jgi:NAD(P)-dependent dehydrogenase (short-subunit alcohol dehydrogenase family)